VPINETSGGKVKRIAVNFEGVKLCRTTEIDMQPIDERSRNFTTAMHAPKVSIEGFESRTPAMAQEPLVFT